MSRPTIVAGSVLPGLPCWSDTVCTSRIHRDHKWVYRRLQSMTQERILLCVDPGRSGVAGERKAAQYRWTWTIQDLPTNDIDALLEGL